ncbi:hypothetical protein [Falsiroseomonas sp.]|uniref:hypothetical protein n=1 Tax=Falsiroseomonas sp. TaxID=2870721 RepID=UPI0034A51954
MSVQAYVCNFDVVAAERFEIELVVIQFDTGKYFSIRGVALQLWDMLQGPVTPEAMLVALSDGAGATSPGAEALATEIAAIIERFATEALIVPADAPGPAPVLQAFVHAPAVIEAYTDLADLVSLDPIHDVNAMMGWPRAGTA